MPSEDITATIKVEGTQQAIKDVQSVEKAGEKLSKQKITPRVEAPPDIAAKVQDAVDTLKAFATESHKANIAARALGDAFSEIGRRVEPGQLVAGLKGLDIPLDQIASHAKGVAAQLAQLSDEELRTLESVAGKRGAAAGELAAGFEEAHAAIAGVVGETTAEILSIGGAASQVTVPVSQLAEQIASLAFKGGNVEALTGLVKAAGPIAAITAIVGLATAAWESYKRKQEEVAKTTAEASKALGEITGVTAELNRELEGLSTGPAASFADQLLASLVKAHPEFATLIADANKLGVSTGDLADIMAGLGKKGSLQGKQTEIEQLSRSLGVSVNNATGLSLAIEAGTGSWDSLVANAKIFTGLTEQQLNVLKPQLLLWQDIANARKDVKIEETAGTELAALEAVTGGLEKEKDARVALAAQGIANPTDLQVMTQIGAMFDETTDKIQKSATAMHQWQLENRDIGKELPTQWAIAKVAADKYRRGLELTGQEQQTVNALASAMGTDVPGVMGKAAAAFDADTAAMKANGEAALKTAEERRKAIQQQELDNKKLVVSMENAQAALDDMGGAFNQMKDSSDALKTAFDLGNAPLDFLGRIRDINGGMRDFAEFISDPKKGLAGKIPNIFDPNDIHAGDFLQKIKSLRDPIQQEIINAFSTGGAPAAEATANQYVDQLFAVLKGKLSKDQIRALLEVGDLNVTLKVAVDQKSKAEAEKELSLLTGLQGGESPFTASIALALAAGTLTPQAAKLLIERQLGKLGVEVPSTLATPDVGKAKSEADVYAAIHPVNMTSNIDMKQTDVLLARDAGQRYATDAPPIVFPSSVATPTTPIKVPIEPVFPRGGGVFVRDAGGTIPSGGIGLVAESRPEIINGRWLATQPMLVPAGTRVTSGARTAHILRTRGTRGLRRYDAGGTVSAVPINITINAAALGARYEIMRTVRNAAKDAARLLGTRP